MDRLTTAMAPAKARPVKVLQFGEGNFLRAFVDYFIVIANEKAGFDGVDIKCCHRYLNSELLSAFNRDGRYGGSLENRTRLLRESVLGAIQSCSKEFLVSSRLNVYDGFKYPYGFGVKKDGSLELDLSEPD